MEMIEVGIIGGGVSGLSFAQQCRKRDIQAVVLEKSMALGGCADTLSPVEGLFIERGPHTLYRIYTQCYQALTESAQKNWHENAPFKHFMDTNHRRIPFLRQLSLKSLWRVPFYIWQPPRGKSLSDFFTPIVGKQNMNACLLPAFDALYCQPAAEYPAELLFKHRDRRALQHLPKAFFLTGGMSAFVAELAHGIDYRLNHRISRISHDGRYFSIATDTDAEPSFCCQRLVLAVPIQEAVQLLHDTPHALSLPPIPSSSSLAFSMLYQTDAPEKEAGVIGLHQPFYSAIFARRLPNAPLNRDGVTLHYRKANLSDEEAVQTACTRLNISREKVIQTWKKINVLPALRPEHLPLIQKLRITPHPSLALIGNYFDGFSLEDCLRRSQEAFVQWYGNDTPHFSPAR